jgi:hypothetical protein
MINPIDLIKLKKKLMKENVLFGERPLVISLEEINLMILIVNSPHPLSYGYTDFDTASRILQKYDCEKLKWRIPTIEELRVVVPKPYNIKNIKLTPHRFWSSTTSSWHNNCYISLDYDYLSERLLNKEDNISGIMGICEIKGENS